MNSNLQTTKTDSCQKPKHDDSSQDSWDQSNYQKDQDQNIHVFGIQQHCNEDEELHTTEWTTQDLEVLFTLYNTYRSQWSFIHLSISTKSKVQIRNRFYGTLRKLIRSAMEFFKVPIRSLSTISNKMRPCILQKIYHSEKEFSFMNGAVMMIIFQMQFRIDKDALRTQFRRNYEMYSKMVNLVTPIKIKNKGNGLNALNYSLVNQQKNKFALNDCFVDREVTPSKENEIQYFLYTGVAESPYHETGIPQMSNILSPWEPFFFYY